MLRGISAGRRLDMIYSYRKKSKITVQTTGLHQPNGLK